MFHRTRYRRGPYALAEPAGVPRPVKALIWLVVLGIIVYFLGKWILGLFGGGDSLQRRAVALTVEQGSTVNVSIEGGLMKRTDVGVPLYEGDKVATGKGHAVLTFFDGTKVRLDEQSELTVDESMKGETTARIALTLGRGTIWMDAPASGSGTVSRSVATPAMMVDVNGNAEAMISERELMVFASEGLGLPVRVEGNEEPAYVGEGQRLALPSGTPGTDLYAYRSALTAEMMNTTFISESRGVALSSASRSSAGSLASSRSSVSSAASIAQTNVPAPAITSPAKSGETYRTSTSEIVIRGTNAASVQGMMVNEYKLQLFTVGKGTWSYLASVQLGNLKKGENIFDVYALDAQGNKSAPVRLTVIYDDGTLPSASSTGTTGSAASAGAASSQLNEASLPNNDPLAPGTLTVTGPTAGTSHTATGGELLIEGATSNTTSTLWVNGYQLQLYKPGVTWWNYIASERFGNLKKGTNTYRITARDSEGRVVDRMVYTVTY